MNAVTEITETPTTDYSTSLLEVISKAARDPNVDIDKMERLLQMQERVAARDAEAAFAKAFAEMQPKLPYISARNKIVHNGKEIAKYADWPSISRAISPILSEYGFGLNFSVDNSAESVTVTARLKHVGGHTETNSVTLPSDKSGAKNNVQAVGSSLTYGQRYAGCPLVGVVIEGLDDDGERAGLGEVPDAEFAKLQQLVQATSAKIPAMLEHLNIRLPDNNLRLLNEGQYDRVIDALESKLASMAKKETAAKAKENA